MSDHDKTMQPSPSPAEAASALEQASRLATSTRAQGWRWVRVYLTGWALAAAGLVLVLGLGGRVGFVVGMSAWAVLVTVGVLWAARQGTMVAGTGRRLILGAAGWAAVFGVTLFGGLDRYAGDVTFWVLAAAVNTVPLLLAAWLPAPRDASVTA